MSHPHLERGMQMNYSKIIITARIIKFNLADLKGNAQDKSKVSELMSQTWEATEAEKDSQVKVRRIKAWINSLCLMETDCDSYLITFFYCFKAACGWRCLLSVTRKHLSWLCKTRPAFCHYSSESVATRRHRLQNILAQDTDKRAKWTSGQPSNEVKLSDYWQVSLISWWAAAVERGGN